MADCPPELPPVEIVFIFWDKEAFAVEMSRLVLEELEAVGVLNMEDEVEFRVPLGLSVLPPTGGGRGSLRLFFEEYNSITLNISYDYKYNNIIIIHMSFSSFISYLSQACRRAELGFIRVAGSHSKQRLMKSRNKGSSQPERKSFIN